jgi:hypothetical protein
MNNWDKAEKSRMIRKRGTDAADEVLRVFAPMWRKPFKLTQSKAELREQANRAWEKWQAERMLLGGSLAGITLISSA